MNLKQGTHTSRLSQQQRSEVRKERNTFAQSKVQS